MRNLTCFLFAYEANRPDVNSLCEINGVVQWLNLFVLPLTKKKKKRKKILHHVVISSEASVFWVSTVFYKMEEKKKRERLDEVHEQKENIKAK